MRQNQGITSQLLTIQVETSHRALQYEDVWNDIDPVVVHLQNQRAQSYNKNFYFHGLCSLLSGLIAFLASFNQNAPSSTGPLLSERSDDKLKSSPIFFKSCPKSNHSSLTLKMLLFAVAQKFTIHLGYFERNRVIKNFQTIAQSDHTGCYVR